MAGLREKMPAAQALPIYLQVAKQGKTRGERYDQLWIGSLTEGGRSSEIYALSQAEMEARATEILVARGIVTSE